MFAHYITHHPDKVQPRAAKFRQLLGEDAQERYIDKANADSKPWYLRSGYNQDDLVLNPDVGIRAGTLLLWSRD